MKTDIVSVKDPVSPQKAFEVINRARVTALPVVDKTKKLIGVFSVKGTVRSGLYQPAFNKKNKFLTSVAIGIRKDPGKKAKQLLKIGADVLVLDTAHGHQTQMIRAIKEVRRAVGSKVPLVAGNVATAQATRDLIEAGADIVKAGVGPGAMCTTRMMTGVGRPQFSAVLECAAAARQMGKHIWADGGVRHPRDVALALAAGASSVMFGSWWAGTFEAAADTLRDEDGRLYKENYGMASRRAVSLRNGEKDGFILAQKELFEEGISESKMYINPQAPSAEDIVDQIVAGLRSSCTYAGAKNLEEFHHKAVVGIQTASGYKEGKALSESW